MKQKVNEYRALNARWKSAAEAAFYLHIHPTTFDKLVRPFMPDSTIGKKAVRFDQDDIDRFMETKKIGNDPF